MQATISARKAQAEHSTTINDRWRKWKREERGQRKSSSIIWRRQKMHTQNPSSLLPDVTKRRAGRWTNRTGSRRKFIKTDRKSYSGVFRCRNKVIYKGKWRADFIALPSCRPRWSIRGSIGKWSWKSREHGRDRSEKEGRLVVRMMSI